METLQGLLLIQQGFPLLPPQLACGEGLEELPELRTGGGVGLFHLASRNECDAEFHSFFIAFIKCHYSVTQAGEKVLLGSYFHLELLQNV